MRFDLEKVLVDSLRGTLHLMLCGNQAGGINLLRRSILSYPMYNLFCAHTPRDIELYFRQIPAWHCIVLEDGTSCNGQNFLPVVRADTSAPVIITGNSNADDIRRHCLIEAYTLGESAGTVASWIRSLQAESFLRLGSDNINDVWVAVQRASLERKLVTVPSHPWVRHILDTLFTLNPLTVEQWAEQTGVTPRKFQREFKGISPLPPKKMLALYHAYRIASEKCARTAEHRPLVQSVYVVCDRDRRRIMEYVLTHRSTLSSF